MAAQILSFPRPFSLVQNLGTPSLPRLIHVNPITRQVRCAVSTENLSSITTRRSANYQPSSWNYDHLQSLESDQAVEVYKDRAKKLEAEVRSMITDENADLLTVLELLDDAQRLGLGYRFKMDISRALDRYIARGGLDDPEANKSLHATALSFRLLRQHGYDVSQDVFNKFKDRNDELVGCIEEDIEGMLSLYEASFLAFDGESFLDKAKTCTRLKLKDLQKYISKDLEEQVNHLLELPSHRWTQRLEAHWSIEAYKKRRDANQALLELAILDFNAVQSAFQSDLQDMSRWWTSVGLADKLSFARDRLVESFYWAVGMAFEPQYSHCREAVTKAFLFVTIIDDVYDVYGTLDELELFTDAVRRWDVNAIKDLPGYMKLCFLALYNTINEMAYEALKDNGNLILPYLKKAWADLFEAFLQEAKWSNQKHTPSFEEYLENAWRSSSGAVLLVHAFFPLGQSVSEEALDSLANYHELQRWPSIIFRLCNDLATSSAELQRGETTNAIACYMNETGLSEERAREHIRELIDEAWKKVNVHQVDHAPFSKPFAETAINLARVSHCVYQHGDGHGAPDDRAKKRVLSLLIEPIPIVDKKMCNV